MVSRIRLLAELGVPVGDLSASVTRKPAFREVLGELSSLRPSPGEREKGLSRWRRPFHWGMGGGHHAAGHRATDRQVRLFPASSYPPILYSASAVAMAWAMSRGASPPTVLPGLANRHSRRMVPSSLIQTCPRAGSAGLVTMASVRTSS